MDFIAYMKDQQEKLTSRDYVVHLWNEIEESQSEIDISTTSVTEFNNHLPLVLDKFWELASEKVINNVQIDEIDEELRIYIMVLIYHSITQAHESDSFHCVSYPCHVYLTIITLSQNDTFFKSKLYRSALTTLKSVIESPNSEKSLGDLLICTLRQFLEKSKLNTEDLEITAATLVHTVFAKAQMVYNSFDEKQKFESISYEALLSLKLLVEKENVSPRKFLLIGYLFNGLRKYSNSHVTPQAFNIGQRNLRRVLKSLHHKFKEDHYSAFLNAFVHVWSHPDFIYFGEAVSIMHTLKEKHYRSLVDILNKMLMCRNPHRNLFKLSLAVICMPPDHVPPEKVKVTNEILFKNLLANCLSSKTEVSTSSIEALAEVLNATDIEKDYVREPMKRVLNCGPQQNILHVSTLINAFKSLMTKKWTNRSKNKNLCVIFFSIILLCDDDHPKSYQEILEMFAEDASPFDLKPYFQLITQCYLNLLQRKYDATAYNVFKLIFKMALHPMASSAEFVKFLYTSMLFPRVCKGEPIKCQVFIDSIISADLNFQEFFQKCNTLGLIKVEHIVKLLSNLPTADESDLKLLCATIDLTNYKNLSTISNYINSNFMSICNYNKLNYLLYMYHQMFKNNMTSGQLDQNLKSNEIMICFIKHHLLKQTFLWDCVPNAFSLLKELQKPTKFAEDIKGLKQEYDRKLLLAFEQNNSLLPLLYYSQLVIFGKVVAPEQHFNSLTNFLMSCSNDVYIRSPEFDSNLYIGCLLLYTNICIINTNLIDNCIEFLQNGLNCSLTSIKLASLNMYFDLCNMITHNFEDLIKYLFRELLYGNDVFKKTCVLKIERLIRDDYLKLELDQFLIFVSILADRNANLSDYLRQLLTENFLISNTIVTARYFVPAIIYFNGYKVHPTYDMNDSVSLLMDQVRKNMGDRRKVYIALFNSLPVKTKFSTLKTLTTQVLEKIIKGGLKFDSGYWDMIKDSIFVFKLMSISESDNESSDAFYKKVTGLISKHILQSASFTEKSRYPEYQREILFITETLLKLLVFNNSEDIQKHIRICLFDTIVHWSKFLLPDLVQAVHVDRLTNIQKEFSQFDRFYKSNVESLRYTEENYENTVNQLMVSTRNSLFNVSGAYVPDLNMTGS